MNILTKDDTLYLIKRRFKGDGSFSKLVEHSELSDILSFFKVEKLLKSTDNYYYLVNEIKNVTIIDEQAIEQTTSEV
jgi:hypothetical protein